MSFSHVILFGATGVSHRLFYGEGDIVRLTLLSYSADIAYLLNYFGGF